MIQARHVFVDLETTGLDAERDVITEIAWLNPVAFDLPPSRHYHIAYEGFPTVWSGRETAARGEKPRVAPGVAFGRFFDDCLRASSDGTPVYLVGACPAFDDRFLRKVYREVPYHYHVIDVEAMAMGALGWDEPRSLRELRGALGIAGINENAHDALADAEESKLIFDSLRARSLSQESGV